MTDKEIREIRRLGKSGRAKKPKVKPGRKATCLKKIEDILKESERGSIPPRKND